MNLISSLLSKSLCSSPPFPFHCCSPVSGLAAGKSVIALISHFPSSPILHITTRLISFLPTWSFLCRPKTFVIFPISPSLIQALHPNSHIFSQPGPNLHCSSQHSEGLKNLSLAMDFRSHLVYPPIACMNPSQHLNKVVMSYFCPQFQS